MNIDRAQGCKVDSEWITILITMLSHHGHTELVYTLNKQLISASSDDEVKRAFSWLRGSDTALMRGSLIRRIAPDDAQVAG